MLPFNTIETRDELADFLGIPRKALTYILYIKHIETMYTSFSIPKKSGGERTINAPDDDLKSLQKKLANALWKHQKRVWKIRNIQPNISHAFEENKSILTNAKIHRNKRFVLNVDLENFFDSFHFGRVRGFFEKNSDLKLPIEVATVIAQIACYKGSLPQGAPCSPIITNMICQVLDMRILKLAKKYKLDYTRYADDLTFSTNDKHFLSNHPLFMETLTDEIKRAGFKINESKTRLLFRDSRQEVTGLIVNQKINVDRRYYKDTRSMANTLYSTGSFEINGIEATSNQLEGRFSFINQIEKYNNINDSKAPAPKKPHGFRVLSGKEEQYRKFLFYKYFIANDKPLVITEGKTDITYIKSALKNLHNKYPSLVTKDDENSFKFGLSFLNRTERLLYLFGLSLDGADTLKTIFNFYTGKENLPNYLKCFKETFEIHPNKPVILIFDNEINNKDKPLCKFANYIGMNPATKAALSTNLYAHISDNLYLLTNPIINGQTESEIEDLFDNKTLSHTIDGRSFSRKDEKGCYGKETFSKHIAGNYKTIDFSHFEPLLNSLCMINDSYANEG